MSALIRHDWDLAEIEALLELPLAVPHGLHGSWAPWSVMA